MANAYTQLSFDDLLAVVQNEIKATLKTEPIKTVVETSSESVVEKQKKEPTKPELPKEFLEKWENVQTLEDLEEFGFVCSKKPNGNILSYDSRTRTKDDVHTRFIFDVDTFFNGLRNIEREDSYLYYIDNNGTAWVTQIGMSFQSEDGHYVNDCYGYPRYQVTAAKCDKIDKGKWKVASRLYSYIYGVANTDEELVEILKNKKPYTYDYLKNRTGTPKEPTMDEILTILIAPELESLEKAGYRFAEKFRSVSWYLMSRPILKSMPGPPRYTGVSYLDIEKYNRLIKHIEKPGKLKNIFKTSTIVCKTLKNETNMDIWDSFRRMDKFGKLTPQDVQLAYDSRLTEKQISNITSILSRKYEGKSIFTFTSLVEYLNRVDMYEAIPIDQALDLIRDYLSQCQMLEIKPRVDGDSLKREHDVVSRNFRIAANLNRNAGNDIKLKDAVNNLKRYDYEEDVFFIRGIRDHKDLLDEANQQHNCVASYYQRICSGTALIFVMREKNNPDKSLVTVELSTDGQIIRQKYLAYNRPIHNAAQSDFLNRWHKHVKEMLRGNEPVHILSPHLDLNRTAELIDYKKTAYFYGAQLDFGYGKQPMENLLKRESDPRQEYKSILIYSKALDEDTVKKYGLTLVKSPELNLLPDGIIHENELQNDEVENVIDI